MRVLLLQNLIQDTQIKYTRLVVLWWCLVKHLAIITELKTFGNQTWKILMCKSNHLSWLVHFLTCILFSLKVVRRTPAIVVTLKTTSRNEEEEQTKVISEQSQLTIDARVDPSSSMLEEKPETISSPIMDPTTSEKPAKVTSTTKRTKKSKSSRKST